MIIISKERAFIRGYFVLDANEFIFGREVSAMVFTVKYDILSGTDRIGLVLDVTC